MKEQKKILAVDDDPNCIAILEELLSEHYDLRTARSGQEALAVVCDFVPDVVLLDVMMPYMDGYELCRRLREIPALLNTTIIMLTAKGELEDKIQGHQTGADDYITKPFEETDLLDSVEYFLRNASKEVKSR